MARSLAWFIRLLALAAIAGVGVFVLNNLIAYEVSWNKFQALGPKSLPDIRSGSTAVIVAPHPDDESLPLGGWLSRLASKGVKVHAIILTNGDAFTLETAQSLRRFKVRPEDYIANGMLRQRESLRATKALGYEEDVTFLGFPDLGTWRIWQNNWTTPYTSPFTQVDRSPYPRSFKTGSKYEGSVLRQELADLFKKYQPDLVVIPDHFETHPDHFACSLFTTLALMDPGIKKRPRVVEYIVHRNGYPFPYGFFPYAFLPPPEGLLGFGLDWGSYTLEPSIKAKKAKALVQYRSQFLFAGYDIAGFYRLNEVGSLRGDVFSSVPLPEAMIKNGFVINPELLDEGAPDPVGDTPQRFLQSGGDVRMIRVANGSKDFVILTMNGYVGSDVNYRIDMRAIRNGKFVDELILKYPGSSPRITRMGKNIEVRLPSGFLGKGTTTFVSVSTARAGAEIDRTAAFFEER